MHHTRRPTKHLLNAMRDSQIFLVIIHFRVFRGIKNFDHLLEPPINMIRRTFQPNLCSSSVNIKKWSARKKQDYYPQRHASSRFDIYTASSAIRVCGASVKCVPHSEACHKLSTGRPCRAQNAMLALDWTISFIQTLSEWHFLWTRDYFVFRYCSTGHISIARWCFAGRIHSCSPLQANWCH